MQMYEPSLDWANELVGSLVWTAKAWVITAVVTVVVLVLLARLTTWGRQFWRVTGGYFRGRESVIVWAWLGALLFLTLISVRLAVLLSYQSNDLYSSLQVAFEGAGAGNEAVRDSGVQGFWTAILTFALIAALFVGRQILDIYLTQHFIIRWRVWLTDRLSGDWLDEESFYRGRFLAHPVDNPDQRIQLDIDSFTAATGTGPNTPTCATSTRAPSFAFTSNRYHPPAGTRTAAANPSASGTTRLSTTGSLSPSRKNFASTASDPDTRPLNSTVPNPLPSRCTTA